MLSYLQYVVPTLIMRSVTNVPLNNLTLARGRPRIGGKDILVFLPSHFQHIIDYCELAVN